MTNLRILSFWLVLTTANLVAQPRSNNLDMYWIDTEGGAATLLVTPSGQTLFAVPSNAGPRTMPNYPALAAQGIYDLGNNIRVFAGTADELSGNTDLWKGF